MQVKTILNRVHKIKGYVYGSIQFGEWNGKLALEIEVLPRQGSRPVCSGCGKKSAGYDRLGVRRYEFVPLWRIGVYLLYRMLPRGLPALWNQGGEDALGGRQA